MNIDINVRFGLSHALHQFLENKIMATLADFTSRFDALDAAIAAHDQSDADATKALQDQIAALQAQIATGGMTAEEEGQALARLDSLIAKFNPAPAPTPEPTPEPPVSA